MSTVKDVCGALNVLLDRVKRSPNTVREFTSNQLPAIVQGLLWFNGADPSLQCSTMQVVARCLVHFTTATLQFRNHLKKWAQSGLFSEQLQLSQVMIMQHSAQKLGLFLQDTGMILLPVYGHPSVTMLQLVHCTCT